MGSLYYFASVPSTGLQPPNEETVCVGFKHAASNIPGLQARLNTKDA